MAQHDYIIANQSGAAFRSDLNNGLAAIVSQNSGAAQPSTTYAYQWWADTTTGLLKLRNAANNAWITIGTLADANLGLLSLAGGTLTGSLTLNAQSELRLADADSSNYVALQAPSTIATNFRLTAPAADGAADQSLVTNGSGELSFASRTRLVRGTSVASTSGTSIDFTGIPSWARRVMVLFDLVSTNGTSPYLLRLGTSGGVASTGYSSGASVQGPTNIVVGGTSAVAFVVSPSPEAASVHSGIVTLANITGNSWTLSLAIGATNAGFSICGGGSVSLSGVLDRVRITTSNGTDTFDAGTINILYEG
jgi:hypothetical protein